MLLCRRVPQNSLQRSGLKYKKLYLHHPEVTRSTWRIYFPGFFTQVKQPSPVAAERNLMKPSIREIISMFAQNIKQLPGTCSVPFSGSGCAAHGTHFISDGKNLQH